ncbi:MAG: ribonuclease HII [Bacteroidales bacterium]|nr:ribonuclease HII [Bacteroidales bacterium]
MLAQHLQPGRREAGCDEAGRGPLAGPVTAAAVLLPEGYRNEALDDSKKLTERQREALRHVIEAEADAWAVATVEPEDIDRLNILHAATHAMCLAANALLGNVEKGVVCGGKQLGTVIPEFLLVDGNKFYNETPLQWQTIVGGDAKYMAIAAASILAKTYRDEAMIRLNAEYPGYGWDRNKGYPTAEHYDAIEHLGITPQHRRSFTLYRQHSLFE